MYPAWFELMDDPVIAASPTALRLYAHLYRLQNVFFLPREVKTWVAAEALHTRRSNVRRAFNLLIQRGYVAEHGRSSSGVRRVTLVSIREPIGSQNGPARSASESASA